jgi:hypothetical protein
MLTGCPLHKHVAMLLTEFVLAATTISEHHSGKYDKMRAGGRLLCTFLSRLLTWVAGWLRRERGECSA